MIFQPVTAPQDHLVLEQGSFPVVADAMAVARRIAACRSSWQRQTLLDALAVIMSRDRAEGVIAELLVRGDVVASVSGAGDTTLILPARAVLVRMGERTAPCGILLTETAETVPFDDVLGPAEWRAISGAPDLAAFAAALDGEEAEDDLAGWRFIGARGDPRVLLDWPSDAPVPPPAQVARLIALFGSGSSAPAERETDAGDLADWAGLPLDPSGMDDPSQQAVAALAEGVRTLVLAGPGAGKTHTIRARVAELDAQGVSPARLLCIVYTRAAAQALSARCADLPGGSRPQIRTLDSLAADLAGIASGGFDATIRAATSALGDPQGVAADYAAALEHVIVDEAQDIVGPRREFLLALIFSLDPRCGVTVFGDPAQAIYDYVDPGALPLHVVLTDDHGFAIQRLERNHRTPPGPLRDFAHGAGAMLRGDTNPADIVAALRSRIEDIAEAGGDTDPTSGRSPDLHLFRSGAAMAGMALDLARAGIAYTMRGGSGGARPPVLAPAWLAPVAVALEAGAPVTEMVDILADDPAAPGRDALADLLTPLRRQGGLSMAVLARALDCGALPALPHPPAAVTLSTIHAAKGLEADHVALYLPRAHRNEEGDGDADAATALEEARILHVGATRARRRLSLRIISRWMSRTTRGRCWRREGRSAVLHLSALDIVDTMPMPGRTLRGAGLADDPSLVWDGEARRWVLHDAGGPLAHLPEGFAQDVAEIGRTAFADSRFIPRARGWLRVRMVTVARGDALVQVPLVEGFVRIGFAGENDP